MMKNKLTREVIAYLVFGVLTTLVNIVAYWLMYYQLNLSNTTSNVISWFLSVTFAYVTNKIWVFESKNKNIISEIVSFFGCRALTGVLEVAIMYLFVDMMMLEGGIVKIASNGIVILLNYVFSKCVIFRKEK